MNRDFKNESFLNFTYRANRAFLKRLRGCVFVFFRLFPNQTPYSIAFDSSPIFINSKSINFAGKNAFGRFARIEVFNEVNSTASVFFGKNTSAGDYFHLGCAERIDIGDNVLIGSKVLIIDHNHGKPSIDIENRTHVIPREREIFSRPVKIGSDVWIGDGVSILPGSIIGKGSIIAANTVVRGLVPEYTIYGK